MQVINSFNHLLDSVRQMEKPCRAAIVCGNDEATRHAVEKAASEGWISPLFTTEEEPAAAASQAVAWIREKKADVILKGLINTDILLRALLNKETGILPKGNILTHFACAEIANMDRLLFFSDAAVIPYPTLQQRSEQLRYAVGLCHAFGIQQPRVSLVHCTEHVNTKIFPFTEDYGTIKDEVAAGKYGSCIVDGPLDLKTSLDIASLREKRINSPLEGKADVILFPDIEAGNVFYKTLTLLLPSTRMACMLEGTLAPVALTSRADNAETKYLSLALVAQALNAHR
ncbi:MAG: phosphate butyryltransferase [Alloprevotella sp.]|nr:phosphate butyryltransferase [Alloprevotella sp.]